MRTGPEGTQRKEGLRSTQGLRFDGGLDDLGLDDLGLAVQTVAGFLGALAAPGRTTNMVWFSRSQPGGLVGGAFLRSAAIAIVTGSGSQNPPTTVELAILRALTGAGAILMFAVGFLKGGGSAAP